MQRSQFKIRLLRLCFSIKARFKINCIYLRNDVTLKLWYKLAISSPML